MKFIILLFIAVIILKIYNKLFLKIQLYKILKNHIADYIIYDTPHNENPGISYNIDYTRLYSEKVSEYMSYFALLPKNYDKTKSYPAIIFLHGINDKANYWNEKAKLGEIYYKLLEEKAIEPMILILPESGDNGKSWYTNWYKANNKKYEDFFIEDFLDELKTRYKINSFAISGFSMGGYGALKLSLKNLSKFVSVSSLAGAINFPRLFLTELKGLGLLRLLKASPLLTRSENSKQFAKVFGEELQNMRKENVYYILRKKCKNNIEEVKKIKFLLSVGEKDNSSYTMLYQWEDVLWEMKKRNLNYKARIIKGEGHYWSYVEKELPYVLKFHSDNFMEAKNE